MYFRTNKEKGNTSLGIAIAYYASNGYTVPIPLNEIKNKSTLIICKKYEKYKI